MRAPGLIELALQLRQTLRPPPQPLPLSLSLAPGEPALVAVELRPGASLVQLQPTRSRARGEWTAELAWSDLLAGAMLLPRLQTLRFELEQPPVLLRPAPRNQTLRVALEPNPDALRPLLARAAWWPVLSQPAAAMRDAGALLAAALPSTRTLAMVQDRTGLRVTAQDGATPPQSARFELPHGARQQFSLETDTLLLSPLLWENRARCEALLCPDGALAVVLGPHRALLLDCASPGLKRGWLSPRGQRLLDSGRHSGLLQPSGVPGDDAPWPPWRGLLLPGLWWARLRQGRVLQVLFRAPRGGRLLIRRLESGYELEVSDHGGAQGLIARVIRRQDHALRPLRARPATVCYRLDETDPDGLIERIQDLLWTLWGDRLEEAPLTALQVGWYAPDGPARLQDVVLALPRY